MLKKVEKRSMDLFSYSSGSLHVIDLKLDSRARPETIRSVSDDWSNTITCLHWDSTSTRLYVGDDMGKVHLMPVHSFKVCSTLSSADNLFKQFGPRSGPTKCRS